MMIVSLFRNFDYSLKMYLHVSFTNSCSFSDQFWYVDNGKLLNKKGNWKHQDIDWRMPNLDEKGIIKDQESGYVLEVLESGIEGCEVKLQASKGTTTESKMWEPVDVEQDGYFKIFHDSFDSGLCLTAKSNDRLSIEGMLIKINL